ncbi:MAG: response regulator transcription factor [Actinomycetota bacterium]
MTPGPRILVVEDDEEMSALIAQGLTAEGYQVTVVTNGMDALIEAAGGEFSAAAIDVMMPEMSGFEVCRHLRNHGNSLPVLLVTARDAVEDRVFGLDSGADDYLTKPFAFAEFAARIRALVRRDAAAPKSVVRAGSIALDSSTVRATAEGEAFPLSSKEFLLLRFLAINAGRAVARAEILQEVWGTVRNIDPTIVDQYVKYLRRKLETVSAGFSIRTVRGLGYELKLDQPREA